MCVGLLAALAGITAASPQAVAQQQQRPNIVFIMGDDIGWLNIGAYHQGTLQTRTAVRVSLRGRLGGKCL
jgi:arylsulfatase